MKYYLILSLVLFLCVCVFLKYCLLKMVMLWIFLYMNECLSCYDCDWWFVFVM